MFHRTQPTVRETIHRMLRDATHAPGPDGGEPTEASQPGSEFRRALLREAQTTSGPNHRESKA